MRPVTDTFLAALRAPHGVAFSVRIVPADGEEPVPVDFTGGDVTIDRFAQIRRTCRLSLAADSLRGIDVESLPFGAYLDVQRGVRYGDGTTELVRLGLLRIDSVNTQTPEGSASISASDRMAQIRDEKLLALFQASGMKPSDAAVALALEVFPTIDYTVDTNPSSETALADVTYDRDRDKAITDLAASVAGEAFFDADGGFVIQPIPDFTIPSIAWTIDVGATGVLISHSKSFDRSTVCNGVLVRGQADASSPPFTVLVVDGDPYSPTYWDGPFGKVPAVIESTAVQDVGQATALGEAELQKRLGVSRPLSLKAVPNPALEAADIVQIDFGPDEEQETHVIDSIRIPLDVTGTIDLSTRSVYGAAGPPATLALEGAAAWEALRA